MSTHTIEISGVSDELLRRLDAKVREQNAPDRSSYILEVLERETDSEVGQEGQYCPGGQSRFQEILAPIRAEAERLDYTDEEIDASVEEARQEYWRARSEKLRAQTR